MRRPVQVILVGICVLLRAGVVQASNETMTNQQMFDELRKMIEMQQQQLEQQAAEIAELKRLLAVEDVAVSVQEAPEPVDEEVSSQEEEAKMADNLTVSSDSVTKLKIYGHINRAILYGDNGDSKDWYFVDNMNSQTRIGAIASMDSSSGWSINGRLEYGIVSNGSSDVNQINNENATSENFKLRWAEISVNHDTFGKLSLGKGSTASDNTARADLSGTSVVAYSSISDTAGSMLWYDNRAGVVTDLRIKDVFSDFDGSGRRDRIRYDTPEFGGVWFAGSISSDEQIDTAVFFNRKYGETKVAAAFSYGDPDGANPNADYQTSGSISVMLPMGLNATFSAAHVERNDPDRESPNNFYGKLGYQTKFYEAAVTSFSVDYGLTSDQDLDGDTATTWALAMVHNVIDWGTEFYLLYRNHQLDRDLYDYDDINVFMTGARIKF